MNEPARAQYCGLGAAARQARLAPSSVRRYLEVGLVQPARVEGGHALFGQAELARLRKIRRLRDDLGLNTAGVQVALHLLDEIQSLVAVEERTRG